MAHDEDIKTKIRAYYECNDLSYAKVTKHFEDLGYEVSFKTVQAWGGKAKWEKNKYKSMGEAVEALLPSEVLDNVTDTVKQTIIDGIKKESGEILTPEVLDSMADAVSEELVWQTLNKHSLMGEMATTLKRAKLASVGSTSIGVHATYHGMLTSTVGTLYGKKVQMVPHDPNSKSVLDKDVKEMGIEELKRLAEEL